MEFQHERTELYLPNKEETEASALNRVTHLAIGAHQDDAEIMAFHGVLECFHHPNRAFGVVVVTDGSGSPRTGVYEAYSDETMRSVRAREQKKAAEIGDYAMAVLLGYPSSTVKDCRDPGPVVDLAAILESTGPEIVYTHNLADKHDTHVAVALRTIEAIRSLPRERRPQKVFGCEAWRSLDWLPDAEKVALDCSAHANLHVALLGVYDSQIAGGKRYDLAVLGRCRANASFYAPYDVDESTSLSFAMDLSPLVHGPELDPFEYAMKYIEHFRLDVAERLQRLC